MQYPKRRNIVTRKEGYTPNTTQTIIIYFMLLILLGAFLLMMPFSSADGSRTSFIDALFTATSAACITGLTTVTTYSHWSVAGQVIILLLIQTGGLGIMTFVAVAFFIIRRKITLRERMLLSESLNIEQKSSITNYVHYIVLFTLLIEFFGACVLAIRFIPLFGVPKGIYYSIFHSVSAFCNAGFDVLGDNSMQPFYNDAIVNGALIFLIVVSGLGFPVWSDVYTMLQNIFIKKLPVHNSIRKLRLHSKIAISATAVLILIGWIFFMIFEWTNKGTMGGMNFGEKMLAGLFQSVTLRTAGFATMDQGQLTQASKFVSSLLMFIGGSPAGTAGGVKTVTIAIMFFAMRSVVKSKTEIVAFKRTISFTTLQKGLTIIISMFAAFTVALTLLTITERGCDFLDMIFEVTSALGTVGLTAGVTPGLSAAGKMIIIVCMFIGRLGPVTIAVAMIKRNYADSKYSYPEGNVIVG